MGKLKWLTGGNTAQYNAHYRACKKDNLPYATIKKRRKYAYLAVDLICTDHGWDLDNGQREKIAALFERYVHIVRERGSKQDITYGVGEYTHFCGVQSALAEEMMEELLSIYELRPENQMSNNDIGVFLKGGR